MESIENFEIVTIQEIEIMNNIISEIGNLIIIEQS